MYQPRTNSRTIIYGLLSITWYVYSLSLGISCFIYRIHKNEFPQVNKKTLTLFLVFLFLSLVTLYLVMPKTTPVPFNIFVDLYSVVSWLLMVYILTAIAIYTSILWIIFKKYPQYPYIIPTILSVFYYLFFIVIGLGLKYYQDLPPDVYDHYILLIWFFPWGMLSLYF